jgi:membrane-associated phospholipid phosphatase
MKKWVFRLIFLGLCCGNLYAETEQAEDSAAPRPALVFHDLGRNLLGAVSYNYGVNFIGAGLGSWAFIATGIDWNWRNLVYDKPWLSAYGWPGLCLGFSVPAVTPIVLYTAGHFMDDKKLLIAGLALTQSLLLTLIIQTPLKMISGRAAPGLVDEFDQRRNSSTDDFSGKFDWFNLNFIVGWPSGHTANAFAAAATLAELYKDNLWLKIGMYSYAALIGLSVTLDVHWASEALAGALIGYGVGKTVGKSFNKLLKNEAPDNRVSFYVTPNALGVVLRF